MLQAWLLILPTFFHLLLDLVGTVASTPKPVQVSFDQYSAPVPIRTSNPLGLSLEFSDFPYYMVEVKQTTQCLLNLQAAGGVAPAVRIGGTTQDRATYDPNQAQPIRYSLPPGEKVANNITFGPGFIELASRLRGAVTFGLNRQQGDLNNAGLAASAVVKKIKNLYALELGNEPGFWDATAPEAHGKPWTPETDADSQVRWQQAISQKVGLADIIQAGVFFSPGRYSIKKLASKEGTSLQYVKSFGPYSFWNQTQVSPTYYGAYFSTLALRNVTYISTIETSNPAVVVYALWGCQKVIRLVVYHSQFYDGHAAGGEPSPDIVEIDRLPFDVQTVRLLRLTAKNSFIREAGPDPGQVQIGGGYFDNATCKIRARPRYEKITTSNENCLEFLIHQSEAVIVELDRQLPDTC
ncbi:hypothetical protein PSTG_05556 [Puccinia striiformis f. sp. tritici PST-78]|uniref:Beta-glucuronidase C-terminal domain-containing protein n=1 Tax=Puccinia striiformis f. sp. tritici PST-78 TaxID=1165861 RepID=A0A0L0VQA9_9BASI|nr:hypothetical protein PSTG_05556 [Puccinia striiformis f. sp. tritici PST-78]